MDQFIKRRGKLAKKLSSGVAILPTSTEVIRNKDAHYLYRFDSYFYYLTGFTEAESIVVVIGGMNARSILFCREKNEEAETWNGRRYGPDRAKEEFRFDETHPIDKADNIIPTLIENADRIFTPIGVNNGWDQQITKWLNKCRSRVREGIQAPEGITDVRHILDEMRLIKDEQELSVMRRAASISAKAHIAAMEATTPGKYEYEIDAELSYHFRKHGSQAPAYTSIVAGGENACILHYVENKDVLIDGDLLLIDAGCELDGYASDITRTFPISGKFSSHQRAVYEIVLEAQKAAIAATREGNSFQEPHDAAVAVIAQGLIDLKLCHGSKDKVIEEKEYLKFYMHRTGHWLGMDVHDVGNYKVNKKWRKLRKGMVLTIEPGCYIRPSNDIPEGFWNIGVRIEDDAVVTANGCDIITHEAPKAISDIESLMSR